jgi:F0F1-type ATP synthase epsilon subunit
MAVRQDASAGKLVASENTKPKAASKAQPTMHVKVYSPYQTYFDQEAYSISAVNSTGPFDVLPRHHNFMTLLNPCEIVMRVKSSVQRIKISRGVMHVKADKVVVFLDV